MSSQENNSAPASARYYTALARLVSTTRRGDAQNKSTRSWQIIKHRRGQVASEIYALSIIIGITTIAATFHQTAVLVPLGGWHWLWLAPLALAASFAIFQSVAITAAVLGSILGSCGFMPASEPGIRTSFFFLSFFTAYAAWAATSGSWVAPLGYVWLALVALNMVASVWLAMREHETRH